MSSIIKKWIDIDLNSNWTPDLPTLRYSGGGIPVFLWDDLQHYTTLKSTLSGETPLHTLHMKHPDALTVRNYTPWYNLEINENSYTSYCLEEPEDVDFLPLEEYTSTVPKQIRGKVYSVSLTALQDIDAYYENETNFDRVRLKVYPSKFSKVAIECFTWFNSVDQITAFDLNKNEYLMREEIDPVAFREDDDVYAY